MFRYIEAANWVVILRVETQPKDSAAELCFNIDDDWTMSSFSVDEKSSLLARNIIIIPIKTAMKCRLQYHRIGMHHLRASSCVDKSPGHAPNSSCEFDFFGFTGFHSGSFDAH